MKFLALLWLAAPLALNPWTADWLLGSAELGHPLLTGAVLGAGLLLAAFGARCLVRGPRPGDARVHALLLGTVVLLPLLGEAAIRFALSRDLAGLREPSLFADPFGDDDYWKLARAWRPGPGTKVASRLDPELGWVNQKTARNPLGLTAQPGYAIDLEEPVLMYGDSFMAGRVPFAQKIPQLVDRMLPERAVYNLAQGGYGVGQIWLRFRRTHVEYERPTVVVGVYVRDLDRTLLSVRSAPKPRFRLERGELVWDAVDVEGGQDAWFEAHPPEIRSWLLALWTRWARRQLLDPRSGRYRMAEKTAVNRAVLAAIVDEARDGGRPLLFVAFPDVRESPAERWKYEFLAATFEDLGADWVDVRALLAEDARRTGRLMADYYQRDNHPNARANAVVATALAARFRRAEAAADAPGTR